MTAAATDFYAAALESTGRSALPAAEAWYVRYEGGRRRVLTGALDRWCSPADDADRRLLARGTGTILDVGCGPGRLVGELARQGRHALGLDISPAALRLARLAGGTVIRRSVFDPLHGEGMWGTVLLADGNIGIGGRPVALLRRCRELIAPAGRVLVEVERPGTGRRNTRIRLERGTEASEWFGWAHVGVDAVDELAAAARLRVAETWHETGRWFAALEAVAPV
ncbi:MAG: 3-demethylubiquinone-9 3-methyltransferase [Blastococcus sp.]|jgi:SAM-dependent methyltransferase|nr:3-demethylubiquinone-9 3-methyltransferase [Blastococcus sp.]